MKTGFDMNEYKRLSRQINAEGCVLLRNARQALPLDKGSKVTVFGRSQLNYYKSGTGSGGLVNTAYVTGILDALLKSDDIEVNQEVLKTYQEWVKDHPFDKGNGWASEPWCQLEMPLRESMVEEAARSTQAAIIVIGRLAGEDRDNVAMAGSYLLTREEEVMLQLVCKHFEKTVVLINSGNIIDMKWVDTYEPAAVLYVWQGGQEGGNAVLDVLTGAVTPCGKLSDTIAYDISDYPAHGHFGDPDRNFYAEDIYVGYRYFETFAPEKVMYPFGYGLSYTTFDIVKDEFSYEQGRVSIKVSVTNTGNIKGKEVVQLYCSAPQGRLGKAKKVLCDFAKTKELQPGETQQIELVCDDYVLASYDDSGITGHAYAYGMEEGVYAFAVGNSIRNTVEAGSFELVEYKLIEQLEQALAPTVAFERMKAVEEAGVLKAVYEKVPLRIYDLKERIDKDRPIGRDITGDKGYKLADVRDGKVSVEEFVAQLSEQDLMCMVRGEGMCSPKATPGTAGAFGGVTENLKAFGIPVGCCADGPSGIRMDCGTIAFAMPNGVCQACTFDTELVGELYEMQALELRKNHVDTLLGPGINIHRHPLNGRNFEYFSEDPCLTGKMAVAQLRAMHKYRVTGTIKHFACNNQEFRRTDAESVVSERAIREIYLKPFEMCVKNAQAYCIMSTYGPVNGFWTASNYDLLTTVLRKEWGYKGVVMTDWWAKGNEEGEPGALSEVSAQVRSQNDLNMVNADADTNSNGDNLAEGLAAGKVTLGELQRASVNICNVLLKMPAMWHFMGEETALDEVLAKVREEEENDVADIVNVEIGADGYIDSAVVSTEKGKRNALCVTTDKRGCYKLSFKLRAVADNPLAQLPVSVYRDATLLGIVSLNGFDKAWQEFEFDLAVVFNPHFYIKFFFGQAGMEIKDIQFTMYKEI
ncbi:MAG: glycoside hydrolase family 3 protein [Lachnospiraceae bacterium]|nr:glycoside hydrolase family 3 protein [Lachnospiraceae bacterium]